MCPNELATLTPRSCGGCRGVLQRGKRAGVEEEWRTQHYAHGRLSRFPPSSWIPDSLLLRWGELKRLKGLAQRLTTSHLPRRKDLRAVIGGPREAANRKCTYWSAETLTPTTPRQPLSEAPRGHTGGGAEGTAVRHPHIRDSPLSTPTPCRSAARSVVLRLAAPRAPSGTIRPGPASPPGVRQGLHASYASLHFKPGLGALHIFPRGLGHFPPTVDSP